MKKSGFDMDGYPFISKVSIGNIFVFKELLKD
jgi:hypothetical protein